MRLLDWHKHDVIEPLYGWRTQDNLRRYRLAYLEVPKKNGVLAPAA
jgi:phage terminase large subunit-like protein